MKIKLRLVVPAVTHSSNCVALPTVAFCVWLVDVPPPLDGPEVVNFVNENVVLGLVVKIDAAGIGL